MTSQTPPLTRLRVAHLNPHQPNQFALTPDAPTRAAFAKGLGLLDLKVLRFEGKITAAGRTDWELVAQLTAQIVQESVISLSPVTTAISEEIRRLYSADFAAPDLEDTEMGDDELEPLGQFINLAQVMEEELALALPLYPRAGDEALDPPTEADTPTRRPFAGLADLLKGKADS